MLSYRHAFHAGNFADVLKHLVLIQIIDYLKQKEKPFCYIDTHAGAGSYSLKNGFALQNREFDGGIGQLWQRNDMPESAGNYVKLIKEFNGGHSLTRYPGSPLLAKKLLRPADRLFLYELHPTDHALLATAVNKDKRIRLFQTDGLKNGLSLLPPHERRGLILIDPSYEIKSDYKQVTETLKNMHKRFATGIYALWYPVIDRDRNRQMEKNLLTSGIKDIQLFELNIHADNAGYGMTGCGMIVINPPWTLAEAMKSALPWLAEVMGFSGADGYRIETLAAE